MHTITLRERTSKLQTTALKRKGLVNEFNNFPFKIKILYFLIEIQNVSKFVGNSWNLVILMTLNTEIKLNFIILKYTYKKRKKENPKKNFLPIT